MFSEKVELQLTITTATDSEVVGFGPLDKVLQTYDGFWYKGPRWRIQHALAPILKLHVFVDLLGVSRALGKLHVAKKLIFG